MKTCHVEDDEHYIEDWEEIQDQLKTLREQYNKLINLLASGNSSQFVLDIIRAEPKEFMVLGEASSQEGSRGG